MARKFESTIQNVNHLTGVTTGLSVQAHWLVLFENNERPRAKGGRKTDAELVAAMQAEFPNGKQYTEADIRMHRQLYISGRLIALRRRNDAKGKDTAREIHRFDENGRKIPNRVNFAPPAPAKGKGRTPARKATASRKAPRRPKAQPTPATPTETPQGTEGEQASA
jgi:hypothetical protein